MSPGSEKVTLHCTLPRYLYVNTTCACVNTCLFCAVSTFLQKHKIYTVINDFVNFFAFMILDIKIFFFGLRNVKKQITYQVSKHPKMEITPNTADISS